MKQKETEPADLRQPDLSRESIYHELSAVLTDYETGTAGSEELYAVLVKIQNHWEDVITRQELPEAARSASEYGRGLHVQIPQPLHAQVMMRQDMSGLTLDQYITWLLSSFYQGQEEAAKAEAFQPPQRDSR